MVPPKDEDGPTERALPSTSLGRSSIPSVDARSVPPGELKQNFAGVYELRDELGAGGMGAVFKAKDRTLNRLVAVKVMHQKVASEPKLLRRFYKEAQITAQLEHPGIVPTYGIEIAQGGQPRLAMRLIKGQTLEAVLAEKRTLLKAPQQALDGLWERLDLFVRVCDAVHFAHKQGVIHRDLKPENIMIGRHRDAYVMDWGLATLRDATRDETETEDSQNPQEQVEVNDDPKATRFGTLMGTVAYMPPEQAKGLADQVDAASDQYALAMTLQEVVTLKDARSAPNVVAGITQAVTGFKEPTPDWMPPGLAAIIARGTAENADKRYADVAALAADVRRFQRDLELDVLPDPLSKRLWRFLSRHQTRAMVAVLVFVVLALGGVIVEVSQRAASQREYNERIRNIARQLSLVSERASGINGRARGVETELARLAGVVQQVLARKSAPTATLVRPWDLREGTGPADTQYLESFAQNVTLSRAAFSRAPDAPPDDAREDENRLALVEEQFRSAFESGGYVREVQRTEHSAPLQWAYAATPSGVLLNFPGASGLDDTYDPRTRPWYRDTINTYGPRWGGLYGDVGGSGTLLPCNRAVYDEAGDFIAVVGLDFRLADVEAQMPLRNLPGYRTAWLLNDAGQVVAEARERRLAGADVQDSGKRTLPKFEVTGVLEAMGRQSTSGHVDLGTDRYLYAAIPALGWTYVVQVRR